MDVEVERSDYDDVTVGNLPEVNIIDLVRVLYSHRLFMPL